ncbi:hypothetical protein LZ30DRAFT_694371 [Colletotrichum cereale]|nr:hypothetical protein LZ30DRAFT_694371 [Colletotrichum cereale]
MTGRPSMCGRSIRIRESHNQVGDDTTSQETQAEPCVQTQALSYGTTTYLLFGGGVGGGCGKCASMFSCRKLVKSDVVGHGCSEAEANPIQSCLSRTMYEEVPSSGTYIREPRPVGAWRPEANQPPASIVVARIDPLISSTILYGVASPDVRGDNPTVQTPHRRRLCWFSESRPEAQQELAVGDFTAASIEEGRSCPMTRTQNSSKAANRIRLRPTGSVPGKPTRHCVLGIVSPVNDGTGYWGRSSMAVLLNSNGRRETFSISTP